MLVIILNYNKNYKNIVKRRIFNYKNMFYKEKLNNTMNSPALTVMLIV